MELGEKLKQLRTERNMTQEQLAAELYVSRTAVSKWETGGGSPNLDSLQAIARLFDVTVDDLLSDDDGEHARERDRKRTGMRRHRLLAFGALDVLTGVLTFLPLCSLREGDHVLHVPLLASGNLEAVVITCLVLLLGTAALGITEVALARRAPRAVSRAVTLAALSLQVLAVLAFSAIREPYAAISVFVLLLAKVALGAWLERRLRRP